jgi:hypothetical protein
MVDCDSNIHTSRRPRASLIALAAVFASSLALGTDAKKSSQADRPQLPWGVTALNPIQTGAYDSKGQAPAEILGALSEVTLRGWAVIWKYYPQLGVKPESGSVSVKPADAADRRFYAPFANEDPGRSPVPLISMICSLEPGEVSGRLVALRAELLEGIKTDDYTQWNVEQLRQGVHELTRDAATSNGVKYRLAKKPLTLNQAVRLYSMTLELMNRDDKWATWQQEVKKLGYGVPSLPDLQDFRKRLNHQLPVLIPPGATRGFLLYRAGWDIGQQVAKEEYEERMDVVLVKRVGATFQLEQFPIYLTNDQTAWNPAWIEPRDEVHDTTLLGRKYEMQWTRFDGPYLWPRPVQLNGETNYRATVQFKKGDITIEGQRFVPRRGAVVKTARDPDYDPLNMKRFEGGEELPTAALTVDALDLPEWPFVWHMASQDIGISAYAQGDRELLWYKTGDGSWSSSVYLRDDAGPAVLRPNQPVSVPTGGIEPRFTGTGIERPSDVDVLTDDQRTSVTIAVALMNRCLASAGGAELKALRVALPRDSGNQTPVFFYAVRNGTSVRRFPTGVAVVLSAGYYNSYVSAFNRLLWVLEKPIADDATKVAAVQASIREYLLGGLPKDAGTSSDPDLAAWSQILRDNELDQLFSASILPGAVKPPVVSAAAADPAGPSAAAENSAGWLRSGGVRAGLDDAARKNAQVALGLLNLYLAEAPDSGVQQWKNWYRQGTTVTFLTISDAGPGRVREEVVEVTNEQGEKSSRAGVFVELASRAYLDYPTTLVWMLGVMEANGRSRSQDTGGLFAGQGSGTEAVLAYYRKLDIETDTPSALALTRLGVDTNTFQADIPDIPTMFLGAGSQAPQASARAMPVKATNGTQRPAVVVHYPPDVGQGAISESEQAMLNDAVRVMNLYLAKPEDKRDQLAEDFRKTLPAVSSLYVYRNSVEAINGKPGDSSALYVGLAVRYETNGNWFVQLLRVLEMQDAHLVKSPTTREGIARSIHDFLKVYAKAHSEDHAAVELSAIDINVMTALR